MSDIESDGSRHQSPFGFLKTGYLVRDEFRGSTTVGCSSPVRDDFGSTRRSASCPGEDTFLDTELNTLLNPEELHTYVMEWAGKGDPALDSAAASEDPRSWFGVRASLKIISLNIYGSSSTTAQSFHFVSCRAYPIRIASVLGHPVSYCFLFWRRMNILRRTYESDRLLVLHHARFRRSFFSKIHFDLTQFLIYTAVKTASAQNILQTSLCLRIACTISVSVRLMRLTVPF